jgi:Subtilase family
MSGVVRPAVLGCLCAAMVAFGAPAATSAEGLTAQARADNGAWLPFAPPPSAPAAICLVDSGVSANPDTASEVLDRLALDGGDPGDVSPVEHGTLMAMEASAPLNGWGMVGTAPSAIRIVSVRAESGTDTLTVGAYKQAIVECQALAERRPELRLKVISMSIGFQTAPSPEQLAELQDAATAARGAGLDLVAAAGDEGSEALSYPAAVPPILSVGAYYALRRQCSFSNGGASVSVLAPGCDLTEASPATGAPIDEYAGTSQAAVICAAALAALRAYEPQLGPAEAEELLTTTARGAGGLDIAALFRAAGLAYLVEAGARREPSSSPTPISFAPAVEPHPEPRLPLPRASLHRRGRRWILHLLNLPGGASAIIRVARRLHGRPALGPRRVTTRSTIRFLSAGPLVITVSYRARSIRALPSASRVLRAR